MRAKNVKCKKAKVLSKSDIFAVFVSLLLSKWHKSRLGTLFAKKQV